MLILLGACGGGAPGIVIDLKTDLVPGVEFSAVRVVSDAGDWRREATLAVFRPDDYAAGRRVFEADVPAGNVRVVVQLLSADATVVAERPVLVSVVAGLTASTVVVTRDCRGVVCPGPGDAPSAVACHGATCVDPRCTLETPELCESECMADADCAPLAPCASGRCEDGVCLYGAEPVRCGLSERCDVELGCVPDSCGEGCARTFSTPMVSSLFVPPACSRAEVRLWGAGGGHVFGAGGGYARATLDLVPGEELIVVVGGPGGHAMDGTGGEGGSPGGGGRGGTSALRGGGGGGGFSGVFRGDVSQTGALLIAGGGGGGGAGLPPSTTSAGAGGGASGQDAFGGAVSRGLGGTQSAGGGGEGDAPSGPLQGALGGSGNDDGGGGGGGGWYGGGGGSDATQDAQSGGGGSGYASGPDAVLETGSGSAPGNADDPERAGFGSPGVGGVVFFTCR